MAPYSLLGLSKPSQLLRRPEVLAAAKIAILHVIHRSDSVPHDRWKLLCKDLQSRAKEIDYGVWTAATGMLSVWKFLCSADVFGSSMLLYFEDPTIVDCRPVSLAFDESR